MYVYVRTYIHTYYLHTYVLLTHIYTYTYNRRHIARVAQVFEPYLKSLFLTCSAVCKKESWEVDSTSVHEPTGPLRHAPTYIHMYTYICICIYVYIVCVCMCVCVSYTHTCARARTHTHTHTQIHTYKHSCMHAYICTRMLLIPCKVMGGLIRT